MKWLWIALGSIAGLTALIALMGAMLPVAHVATRRVRFRQPPEAVWNAMSPGTSQTRFRQDDVNYEVTEFVPNRRLVTRIVDKNMAYGGSWTYELQPEPDGSTLQITENGEVYNPIFRFVSKFLMGHTATIDSSLKVLGGKLGEAVVIEN